MLKYFRKHWIVVLISLSIWGVTFWISSDKPKSKVDTVVIDTISVKKDSVRVKVDSIVSEIDMKQKYALKKLKDLEDKKKLFEEQACLEKKKRLEKEKEIQKQLAQKKEVKEVIKEKKVFVKDPELESKVFSYEEENKHLKEELEKTYYVNQKLIKEKEDMMKVTSTREESSTDTVTKKKRKFKLFSD